MKSDIKKQIAAINKLKNISIEEVEKDIYRVKISGLDKEVHDFSEAEMLVDFTYAKHWSPYDYRASYSMDNLDKLEHPIVLLVESEDYATQAAHILFGVPSPKLRSFVKKKRGKPQIVSGRPMPGWSGSRGRPTVLSIACYDASWFTKAVKTQDLLSLVNGIRTCFHSYGRDFVERKREVERYNNGRN